MLTSGERMDSSTLKAPGDSRANAWICVNDDVRLTMQVENEIQEPLPPVVSRQATPVMTPRSHHCSIEEVSYNDNVNKSCEGYYLPESSTIRRNETTITDSKSQPPSKISTSCLTKLSVVHKKLVDKKKCGQRLSVPGFSFRPMELDDIYHAHNIDLSSFLEPWSIQAFRDYLRCPDTTISCAAVPEYDGDDEDLKLGRTNQSAKGTTAQVIIGYGLVSFDRDDETDEAHLDSIALLPEYRRRGLGRVLLSRLISKSVQAGAGCLTLHVRRTNKRAISMYKKSGFVITDLVKDYYEAPGGKWEDAFLMMCNLKTA